MNQLMLYLWILAHGVTGAIVSLIMLNPLIRMLREAGAVKTNYCEREVVNLAGVLIILAWIVLGALAAVFPLLIDALGIFIPQGFVLSTDILVPLTIIILGAGFFGLVDDFLGNRDHSGFRGHIGALFRGRLTTGAIKAIGVPAVALIASSLLTSNIFELFGYAILIALFVNTFNLFDLRPGRALKIYIPLQLLFVFIAGSALGTTATTLVGITLVMIGPDLKEKIMLGDTGSNILGGVLGFSFAISFGWSINIPIMCLLLFLQLLTEKFSLTSAIEKTPLLRMLDNLGRKVK